MNRQGPTVPQAPARAVMRTTCGRQLVVGRLRLDGLAQPVRRVTLDVARQPYDHDDVWTSLTVPEAKQLAALLLQAAEADGETR